MLYTLPEEEEKNNYVDSMTPEERAAQAKIQESVVLTHTEGPETVIDISKKETESVLSRMVAPHSVVSREVTEDDIDRVIKEAQVMHQLCFTPNGNYQAAYAVHHAQIDDKDPLNFFVTGGRNIIINPKIIRHSSYMVDSDEGCITYPHVPEIRIQRYRKLDVEYRTIMTDPENPDKFKMSDIIEERLTGRPSFVFQHEFDHGSAKYIYQ